MALAAPLLKERAPSLSPCGQFRPAAKARSSNSTPFPLHRGNSGSPTAAPCLMAGQGWRTGRRSCGMCSSRESCIYSSRMQALTRRDPDAMCLRLLSLIASLAPESPTTSRLTRRASESRFPPACYRQRRRHSEGMRRRKGRPSRATSARSPWSERDVTSSRSWDFAIACWGEKDRTPAFAKP